MKKCLLICAILVSQGMIHAQGVWMELGAKAGYGLGGFYNGAMMDDGEHSFKVGFSPSYGLKMGLYFSEFSALSLEGLLSSNHQNFTLKGGLGDNVNNINWKTLDIVLAYRFTSEGGYIEIGPMYSKLNSVTQKAPGVVLEDADLKKRYQSTYGVVFGLGGYFAGSEYFTISSGIRFQYGFSDLVSSMGKDEHFPTPYKPSIDYKGSHPFGLQLQLEITFPIGGYAQSQCGRRGFIMGSGR